MGFTVQFILNKKQGNILNREIYFQENTVKKCNSFVHDICK